MTQIIITNCDSDESPLRDFNIKNGDVFSAQVAHRGDGKWHWLVIDWEPGVDLEIMPDEAKEVGENVSALKPH
ncbi:hypothetical protein B7L51_019335 [Pectobacterium brasiliense]|uniref:hypothetical protein n=1 Tax=Pectobacterium brasiliense TaxID=180957 RepID=UPI000B96B9CC|nr:hypothetical protein [Pectobacterium carotovorum]OYN49433.1 hypothetical protein B7L51_19380 [Pectobacterium carotovorum]